MGPLPVISCVLGQRALPGWMCVFELIVSLGCLRVRRVRSAAGQEGGKPRLQYTRVPFQSVRVKTLLAKAVDDGFSIAAEDGRGSAEEFFSPVSKRTIQQTLERWTEALFAWIQFRHFRQVASLPNPLLKHAQR